MPRSKPYSTDAYFEMVMNRKVYKTVPDRVLRNPKVKEEIAPLCKAALNVVADRYTVRTSSGGSWSQRGRSLSARNGRSKC